MHDRRFTDVVRDRVTGAASRLADAIPTGEDLKGGASRASRFIRDNPIGTAIGAAIFGFVVGLILPATAMETERIRDVKRAARDASAEAIEAGREMVLQTVWTTLGARRTNGRS